MKILNVPVIALFILISSALFAQENLYVGMTADEFMKTLPGVLPGELVFNGDLYMQEKMHNIEGKWAFGFNYNKLSTADFTGDDRINSEDDFNRWVESAILIIEDYTKIYGQPVTYEKGNNKYFGRNSREYENKTGKREAFEEAIWKTNTMHIKISCDYRSNYYEEFRGNAPNGPPEWYSYFFQITYSLLPDMKAVKFDEPGKFYIGMEVKDFAKVFPDLFPNGVNFSGQWQMEQNLYGLTGSWSYTFREGKLNWIHYQKYFDEINEKNFALCLKATRQLIKDYTDKYGTPDSTVTGNTTFVDPYVTRHWGYDVLEVFWKDYKGMKIKIEFTFMGGKGQYHFLVKINYFDKDYPYYD